MGYDAMDQECIVMNNARFLAFPLTKHAFQTGSLHVGTNKESLKGRRRSVQELRSEVPSIWNLSGQNNDFGGNKIVPASNFPSNNAQFASGWCREAPQLRQSPLCRTTILPGATTWAVSRQVTPGRLPGGQVPGQTSARQTSARADKLPQDKC